MAAQASHDLDGDLMDIDIDYEIPAPVSNDNTPNVAARPPIYDDEFPDTTVPAVKSVFNKIFLSGVNDLSTDDIKNYCTQHNLSPTKVEWINDSCANLLFSTEQLSGEGLCALTGLQIADLPNLDLSQLRPAPDFSSDKFPNVPLQVRISTNQDVKKPRSYISSRYYLFHPDQDPEELGLVKDPKEEERRRGGGRHSRNDRNNNNRSNNNRNSNGSQDSSATSHKRTERSRSPTQTSHQNQRSRRDWRNDDDDLFASQSSGANPPAKVNSTNLSPDDLLSSNKPTSRLDAMFAERKDSAKRVVPSSKPQDLIPSRNNNNVDAARDNISVVNASKRVPPKPITKVEELKARIQLTLGQQNRENRSLASRIVPPGGKPQSTEDLFGPKSDFTIRGLAAASKDNDLITSGSHSSGRNRRQMAKAHDFN